MRQKAMSKLTIKSQLLMHYNQSSFSIRTVMIVDTCCELSASMDVRDRTVAELFPAAFDVEAALKLSDVSMGKCRATACKYNAAT